MHRTRFLNIHHHVLSQSTDWKPIWYSSLWEQETKCSKQDSHNRMRSPIALGTSRRTLNLIINITGFVARLTRRVSLMEQELLTLPEHFISPPVFSGVPVTRSLVLCVCFVDRCLSFCSFSFGHCVVCSSSIYGFWLSLLYLKTLLALFRNKYMYS